MNPIDVLVQSLSDDEYDRLYEVFRDMTEKSWRVSPEYHVACALGRDQSRRCDIAVREAAAEVAS